MGSRIVDGHEHVLDDASAGRSTADFSLVSEVEVQHGCNSLIDAMDAPWGSPDLDLDESQSSFDGSDFNTRETGIENPESFADNISEQQEGRVAEPSSRVETNSGLEAFKKRFFEDEPLDFNIGLPSYQRDVVVDSAWTSLSAKPIQHFWEKDFWQNMMSDDVHPLDLLTSGLKRPIPIQADEEPGEPEEAVGASKPKAAKHVASDFMMCVKDVMPQNWKEERDSLHQVAIFRWHSLLLSWHDDVDISRALQLRPDKQSQLQVVVDVLYNKSPSTLMKRVRSLARVTNHCLDRGISFPCTEEQMYNFLCEERAAGAPPSRMKAILEACVFARHVLGVEQMEPIITSRRCSGTTATDINKVIQQSTPLTVNQLKRLHEVLTCDPEIWNRTFAGMTLFCVYARSRWNDSQHAQKLLEDRDMSGTLAFLEVHTSVHKTARALQLRHVFLPLVSPAIGVTSDVWAEQWLMCRKQLDIEDLTQYPLMPAPSASGEPTVRALTTSEAGQWLRMLLKNPQVADHTLKNTSHSLKSTCLSYLAKRGVWI